MHWNDVFRYDSGKLYWVKRKGNEAGSYDGHGYLQTQCKGVRVKNHRIIWEMHNGPIPCGMQVDHINRVRDDNRIENLRLVTQQQNLLNNNAKGCSYHKHAKKWIANITVEGKMKHLGYFKTETEAHDAYLKAKEKYHALPHL